MDENEQFVKKKKLPKRDTRFSFGRASEPKKGRDYPRRISFPENPKWNEGRFSQPRFTFRKAEEDGGSFFPALGDFLLDFFRFIWHVFLFSLKVFKYVIVSSCLILTLSLWYCGGKTYHGLK